MLKENAFFTVQMPYSRKLCENRCI